MSRRRIELGTWSASLWICGWAMHDEFQRTGHVDVIAMALVLLLWARVNMEVTGV